MQQEQEQSKTAAAPKGGASATSASTESKETDIERKKREADELLKGIIPDDVIDGTAGLHCFFSKIFSFVYLFNNMNTFMFKSHQPSYEFVFKFCSSSCGLFKRAQVSYLPADCASYSLFWFESIAIPE